MNSMLIKRIGIFKIFLTCYIFCQTLNITNASDYSSGWVIKNDGSKEIGFIKPFDNLDKKIFFKKNNSDKKFLAFLSTELKEIAIIYAANDTLIYHKFKAGQFMGFKYKLKISDNLFWATKKFQSTVLNGYISYYLDSNAVGTGLGNGSKAQMQYWTKALLVQFPGEEHLIYLSDDQPNIDFGSMDKVMRNNFERTDRLCPEFLKLMGEKKYKVEDFIEMLTTYSNTCKG